MARSHNCGKCNKPKSKCECWRPSKMTEDVIKILESIFQIDWTIEEACSQAGIKPQTYHKRYKENNEFSDRIDRAKAMPYIDARHSLVKEAKSDWKAAVEFLKRRDKRYKDKQELDIDADLNLDYKSLSVEELINLAKSKK